MIEKTLTIKRFLVDHFFDFLMLFLAITLGFFVDNYRESVNNAHTAKDLAADLISDISKDTLRIKGLLLKNKVKIGKLDSLFVMIDVKAKPYNDSLIYLYSAYSNQVPWFERNGGTYKVLTNTGSLDYFSKDVLSKMAKYELDCIKTISLLEQEGAIINEKILPFQQKIFHTENFQSLLNRNRLVTKSELHNWNNETKWLYHNYITELKIINQKIFIQFEDLLLSAKALTILLIKEYRFS